MDKDFDMEKVIDKMRELRDKRDLEILKKDLDDINIDSDYKKELPVDRVLNVKYLGKIKFEEEINGEKVKTDKDIYLVIEQKEDENGNLFEIERYCTEDGKVLGGNNKSDNYNFIILSKEYEGNSKLLEKLEALDKQGILDLNELEQERLEEIARVLGIDPEDIDKLAEISDEDLKKAKEKADAKENLDEKDIVLSKDEVEKISTKQEIKTDQKITDKDTMASMLKIQGKGYKKIAVIHSDKLKDNENTTKFSFVGINEDGSAERIDSLEQRYGNAPTKNVNVLNRDGSNIQEQQMTSFFSTKGNKESGFGVRVGSMGTIEVNYIRTPNQDNGKAISIPVETQNIRPTTREVRELMNENRNPRVKEEIEKIEEHREAGDESNDINVKDIDDNPYNDSHQHFEVDNVYLYAAVRQLMDNGDIDAVFTEKEVADRLKNNIQRNIKSKSLEQIKAETESELEEDASHFRKLEKNQ